MYILSIIRGIYSVLNREQRTKMLLLQLFFAFSAVVQVFGVASIAPFIGLISNPESVSSNAVFSFLYQLGGFKSIESFITGFAVLSVTMIVVSNSVSALTLWLQLKFSIYLGAGLQFQIYEKFLSRDYLFHKNQNYNKLISIIAADAPRFIYMVLQPYLLMCSQIFVAIIILGGLVILDPLIAVGAAILIGGAYAGTYALIKRSLGFHGEVVTQRNRDVQGLLSESFIGIKDIKLNALEEAYTARYKKINKRGLDSGAFIALSGDLPRFAIETISFGAILLFAILLFSNHVGSENLVSILSIYALAGYKLLPTMQQIYKSISSLSANGGVVLELRANLEVPTEIRGDLIVEQMPALDNIDLRGIEYQYPSSPTLTLDNINLRFERGLLNTIAGPSGSGKSTLADIILGLLSPSKGTVVANELIVDRASLASYQRSIGYVPQHIFILDDTVLSNVAFGVPREEIDLNRVVQALTQAGAIEFVNRLPGGLDAQLGQDGKLLSGGQRQRIGIARALYRNNRVLVLDEPTSALDITSEHDLMSLLNGLKKDVLIIVISHRPAAIRLSDKIVVIAEGKVVADGAYAELIEKNDYFRSMIEKGFITG